MLSHEEEERLRDLVVLNRHELTERLREAIHTYCNCRGGLIKLLTKMEYDFDSENILGYAIIHNDILSVATILKNSNVDINKKILLNGAGYLNICAARGYKHVMKILLENGIQIDETSLSLISCYDI